MILTYILRSLRRRKVRSILMILALIVGVGTLVALNATVDSYRRFYAGTVAGEVGAFDLVIVRPDTAGNPFLDPKELAGRLKHIPGVYALGPRIHSIAFVSGGGKDGDAPLVALDPAADKFGSVEATDGVYDLGPDKDGVPGAFVLKETADIFGLKVGDPIQIRYASPLTRAKGRAADDAASRRRTTASWIVRGIGTQRGVMAGENMNAGSGGTAGGGSAGNNGVVISLASAQARFGLEGLAERVIVGFDPAIFDSTDPQRAAFNARQVSFRVRDALGTDDYLYLMPRPKAVMDGANGFIFFQSLIGMYGILSLGVVGLLIRTLIMTNVQEQTRDMAILRILGAPRRHLFNLVMAEVAVVGVVGVGLGILVGQSITNLVIVPLIAKQAGGMIPQLPLVSPSAVLISVTLASIVLAVSALAPARTAAGTKVTHAINPGIADGLGLEDLAKMRERRTDIRTTGIGLVVLIYPALIFFAFPLAFDFGILWVLASLIFGALLAMILGAALVFFLVILPMERALLWFIDRVRPRVGYFVRRTVLRGKVRNTLISLMIVVSATLPTFLSTSLALDQANTETDRRLTGGAPFRISPPAPLAVQQGRTTNPRARPRAVEGFKPELLAEVRADPGFAAAAAITGPAAVTARDGVGLREVAVSAVGVDGDLAPVLYPEAQQFVEGDAGAFKRLLDEPGTAVLGAGLATYFDRHVGDTLILVGAGRDHLETVKIVAIANQVGGVGVFTAKQTQVLTGGSTVLVSVDAYRKLVTDPLTGPPNPNARIMRTLLATPAAGVDEAELTADLRLRYATEQAMTIDSTAETVKTTQEEAKTGQLFMVILTALTSALAVFGVFAVIYVSIYGRRGEIGMMKAIGSPGGHLLAVFVGEAMVMTLSATLTGVAAGIAIGYALRLSEGFQREVPTKFAIDPVVVPAMLILMIFASFLSAVVATHSYRRRQAIEIMRSV